MRENTAGHYRAIDLFAGIGGIRTGFALGFQGNLETVFVSEWDKWAQKTYRANYGGDIAGDITKVDPESIPDFDICLAGFPCQPFSQAGKGLGFSDTRGTLFFNIEAILRAKRPRVFFLENVKRLRTHDHGNTFATIQKHLTDLGYSFDAQVLNAKDFGVPQNRERIFMVGFDRKRFSLPQNWHFVFPEPIKTPTRVGDILEPVVEDKYTISDALWAGHQRRKQEHQEKGNGFGYSLFSANSPYTNTISARYYKDGSEALVEQEGKNPRKLTPRECARLQGFPEDFQVVVSDNQAYKQFGNSVAVPVVREIAEQIFHTLEELESAISP